jgi:PAS domain S-box-containing protein
MTSKKLPLKNLLQSREKKSTPIDPMEIKTDQERRKVFLRYANRAWLIFGIVTLVSLPFFPKQRSEYIFLIALIFPTYLIIRLLNLSARTKWAGVVFTLSVNFGFYGLFMLLVGELGANKAFETEPTVWMLMGLAVLFAGAFVDKRAAPVLAVLNSILLIGTRLMLAPDSDPRPSILVFWWMVALTSWLYEGTLYEVLRRSWAEAMERKLAEETILKESEFNQLIIANAGEGICVCHDIEEFPNVRFTIWNEHMNTITGYSMGEINRLGWYQSMYPDPVVQERAIARMQRMRIGDNLQGEEWEITRADGGKRQLLISTRLLKGDKDTSHVLGVMNDVTEHKRAEDALRASEEQYRTLFENAPIGIGVADSDGSLLAFNEAMLKPGGYSREDINTLGGVADLYYNPEQRGQAMALFNKQGFLHQFPIQFKRKDGSPYDGQLTLTSILFDGKPCIQAIIEDITERVKAEEALRESEEKFRKAFTISPDSININRLQDGMYITINNGFSQIMGYTPEECIGKTSVELNIWDRPEDRQALVEGLTKRGEVVNLEARFRAKNGDIKYGLISASMLELKGIKHILSITRDITGRKRAEQALVASESELRALFASMEDVVLVIDRQGVYRKIAPTNPTLLVKPPDELLGKNLRDIFPAEQAEAFLTVVRKVLETQQSVRIEYNLLIGERPTWFATSISPMNADTSLWVARDITARKHADDEILNKSKELEALFTISSHLRTAQTVGDMLPVVLTQMSKVLNADANAVILLDPDQTHFTYTLGDGLLKSNTGLQFDVENSISGHILQTRQPYITLDYANDPLRSGEIRNSKGIGPTVIVPLQSETEFVGTLLCARAKDSPTRPFSSAEVQLLVSIGEMVGNALRRAYLYDDALSRLQRVQGLRSIDSFINANMDIKITLNLLVNQALSLMKVDAAAILLNNPILHTLEYATAQGFHYKDIEKARFELDNEFSERALMERRIITASDLSKIHDSVHKEMMQKEGFVACNITPMIAKGRVLGILELFNRTPLRPNQEWLDFLEALGAQAAIAIDNAHLFRDLQTSNLELALAYDATIQGWSQALELKDRETKGHTLRVTQLTISIAKLAGLNEDEIIHIRRGALLHDIGKMGIPDHILNKTGKLTPKEWDIILQHPQNAFDMLHPIEFLRPALDIPYYHHEKWDGTGYPHGLHNVQIPFAARLFAVVDVWDALTSNRIYRKAWPKKKAFAYIQEQTGKYFDPQAVDLFLKSANTMISRKK